MKNYASLNQEKKMESITSLKIGAEGWIERQTEYFYKYVCSLHNVLKITQSKFPGMIIPNQEAPYFGLIPEKHCSKTFLGRTERLLPSQYSQDYQFCDPLKFPEKHSNYQGIGCNSDSQTLSQEKQKDRLRRAESMVGPNNVRKGRKRIFNEEEEKFLKQLVDIYGEGEWSTIAKLMPFKDRKQIREQYLYYMKKEINYDKFTKEEECYILDMISKEGKAWTKIAEKLPGKNPIMIKNFYYAKIFRKKNKSHLFKKKKKIVDKKNTKSKEERERKVVVPMPLKAITQPLTFSSFQYSISPKEKYQLRL